MRFRRLGRTGLSVSEATIGTARLDAPDLDMAETRAAVALALEAGVNAVEASTASAGALAELLAGRQAHVFARVTSRVRFDLPSPHITADQAYPGAHIRAETEAMLETLGVERLAILQLHAWCPEWLHEGDWLETLVRLRYEGKIAGIGVSLFDHDLDAAHEVIASGAIDCVQVMYNVFDQGAADALFPLCARHDLGVIARSPLYYGALAGREFAAGDWRRDYFYDAHGRETAERVERLAAEVESPDRSVADMALRFAVSHPAVSTVAVGMLTPTHVRASLEALARGPLDAGRLARHRWLC